jgi:RecB family exonuclease
LRIVQPGQTVEDFFNKGRLFLENYYHRYAPFDQDRTEGIEMKVTFDLDAKGEFKMQGYIDRLGRDDEGTLWIHDYKTSSRKMSEEDARGEDQLALYQIGLEQHPKFGPKEHVKLLWHFVAFEKDQVTAERNPKEIGWLKEKYVSKIQTIEKAREFPTKPSALCGWCEFLPVCAEGKRSVEARRTNGKQKEGTMAILPPAPLKENLPPSASKPVPLLQAATDPAPLTVPAPPRKGKRSHVSDDQLRLF